MIEISARVPMGTSSGVVAWGRTINGVTYWFNATPYDVKVFRLRLDGGDLVHHRRDVPELVGEYDRYDPSTHPLPGEIAWAPHWDRRSSERVYYTSCRVCRDVVEVTREQLVAHHGDKYGTRTCEGSAAPATLKAAIIRDDQPSPEEKRVAAVVGRWLGSCTGFDTMYGTKCHHPGCQGKTPTPVLLELRALRGLNAPDSELARYFAPAA